MEVGAMVAKGRKLSGTPKEVVRGVPESGWAQSYKRNKKFAVKKKNGGKFPVIAKKPKAAEAAPKAKWYPTEDIPKPLNNRKKERATKLRSSLVAGTVCILLAGPFKGKRVVFLKQLKSGLILVTGPFGVNGVPLRRVNQVYVIATSTKVDASGAVAAAAGVSDDDFKKDASAKGGKKSEGAFFGEKEAKAPASAERKALQAKVDAGIKVDADMKNYLATTFTLRSGDRPHEMKF